MTRLVDAGLVDGGWKEATDTEGLVTTSLVSFVVRKGNPKNIKTWDDLVKPGVEVLTPNPFTSGAAKWNLLAAYGANGGLEDPEKGLAYLEKLLNENVVAQDKSGRDALQNFTSGTGDVLLSYEYEAITAQKKGETDIEYVVPDDTIKIDIDVATTKDAPEEATAVPRLRRSATRPSSASPTGATARSTRRCSRPTRTSSRTRAASSPSRTSVAGRRPTRCSTSRRAARSPSSRKSTGIPTERLGRWRSQHHRVAPPGAPAPGGHAAARASARCGSASSC